MPVIGFADDIVRDEWVFFLLSHDAKTLSHMIMTVPLVRRGV